MKTWAERIAEARERGHFSPEDWSTMASWQTCAVGEAMHARAEMPWWRRLSRPVVNWPFNPALQKLGMEFVGVIARDKFDRAEEIVRQAHAVLRAPYPEVGPSDESLIAATVEEAKKHAAEELVGA